MSALADVDANDPTGGANRRGLRIESAPGVDTLRSLYGEAPRIVPHGSDPLDLSALAARYEEVTGRYELQDVELTLDDESPRRRGQALVMSGRAVVRARDRSSQREHSLVAGFGVVLDSIGGEWKVVAQTWSPEAPEPPSLDVRWYVRRPRADGPIELQDSSVVWPLFEMIETGWLCDPGGVERDGDGNERRVLQCQKRADLVEVTVQCGPDRPADAETLRFARLDEAEPWAPDDTITLGCVVR